MLLYSRHAKAQMKERGISKAEVQYCLENYDETVMPKKGCSLYFANHPSGKRIKVVFDHNSNKIVTVILLD